MNRSYKGSAQLLILCWPGAAGGPGLPAHTTELKMKVRRKFRVVWGQGGQVLRSFEPYDTTGRYPGAFATDRSKFPRASAPLMLGSHVRRSPRRPALLRKRRQRRRWRPQQQRLLLHPRGGGQVLSAPCKKCSVAA